MVGSFSLECGKVVNVGTGRLSVELSECEQHWMVFLFGSGEGDYFVTGIQHAADLLNTPIPAFWVPLARLECSKNASCE